MKFLIRILFLLLVFLVILDKPLDESPKDYFVYITLGCLQIDIKH